jgi:F-type H+-transporting ATPase subunit c
MKKLLTAVLLFSVAAAAFAQGAPEAAEHAAEAVGAVAENTGFFGKYLAHLSLAIAAAGCGLGQGKGVMAACEGIARNPQAAGAIRTTMIIGLALIEALVIYVLVAAFAIK